MALVDEEGWRGYSVADLASHHENSPENCFKLVVGDRLVGDSFALTVAEISYLSFFLIDRGHRSLQSARALGLRCLSAAWERSRLVVAYANRRAVCIARTGFRTAHWVTRYQATLVDSSAVPLPGHSDIDPVDVEEVLDMDQQCYGADRRELFNAPRCLRGWPLLRLPEARVAAGWPDMRLFGSARTSI